MHDGNQITVVDYGLEQVQQQYSSTAVHMVRSADNIPMDVGMQYGAMND